MYSIIRVEIYKFETHINAGELWQTLILNHFFQVKLHASMISYLLSVQCQELSSIPNGLYNLTTDSTSTYASYSCGAKYYINGPSVRKCLDSGLWDGIDPRCGKKIS